MRLRFSTCLEAWVPQSADSRISWGDLQTHATHKRLKLDSTWTQTMCKKVVLVLLESKAPCGKIAGEVFKGHGKGRTHDDFCAGKRL